ncbi:MAG TPA: YcaO-like family protein [Gaiellaceae bacterium]|nr:YcaO-like family protein [Gaiellaceae bacterium]
MIAATLSPRLRRAVSAYAGIVGSLEECLAPAGEPALFRAACDVARSDALLGAPIPHVAGVGGAGATRAEAAAAAVGEALERYSLSFVPRERLVVATAAELGAGAVDPERFALFSERQHAAPGFPFRPFTRAARVAWVQGRALPGGEPAWLPAELVYLADARVEEAPIAYATSSGAACGERVEETLVRGLCELLERDAFMVAWSARLSLPRLDPRARADLAAIDDRFFARTGLAYAAVDLSPFHALPSVLGVVRAPAGCPGALGVGAGTAPTLARAFFKALAEAFASRAAGAKLALLEPKRYGPLGEGVASFEDHIRFYADHARAAPAAFLDAGPATRTPPEELRGEPVAALCARVAAAGASAYAVDATSPDVAELGLVVTKVVAPELCALDVAHAARFLGGRRLRTAAAELGLAPGPLAEADLNPYPHPFP